MKENLKKLFAVVLTVVMLATQIVVPANAVNTDYCKVCKAEAVRGELLHTIAATCEDGFEIYACAREILDEEGEPTGEYCTGTITVRIGATGDHTADGVIVDANAPTCTEDGNFEYQTCAVCEEAYLVNGAWVDSYVDPATGHDYEDVVTPPDCINDGFTTKTCKNCGDVKVENPVPCNGHNYELVPGQAATCKEAGWEDYYKCTNPGCEQIDPERPYVELPVEDHGLKVVDTKAPTCTEDGWNKFKCEEDDCPYFDGVTETLSKNGHTKVKVQKVPAACGVVGYKEHYKCTVCEELFASKTSNTVRDLAYFEIPALEHTEVLVGFRAATCTEEGLTNAIVCDGCGFVHHAGEVIPATGHTLTLVEAVEAECLENGKTVKGNIEHKHCSVCEKNFAPETENMDIEAEPLATVVTTTAHEYEKMVIAPKCTEQGYTVYTCEKCYHTYSEAIAPAGHSFEAIEKVEPTCTETGVAAHNKCTVCELLFAADADQKDITIEAVDAADLVLDALGHEYEVTEFVKPTYTSTGTTKGQKCERCDAPNPTNPAETLAKLQQEVKFYYELAGVAGAEDAVNSGYVTLKVYMDVLVDEINDKEEYESDVLAEIYGVDFAISYNKDVFKLTYVNDVVSPFGGNFAATPLATANEAGKVSISQDTAGNTDGKIFRGKENLLTVLTFQVNDSELIAKQDYNFTAEWDVTNPDDDVIAGTKNVLTAKSETSDKITVKMLGDANDSGTFSAADTMLISQFIKSNVEGDKYIAEYDMNKDGFIDGQDLNLIRRACVADEAYKAIEVDPNAVVTPEV